VKIIGVSFDSPSKNDEWAIDEGFEFDLWSDLDRDLALYYGAATSPTQGAASRVTKVLDANGDLVLEYDVNFVGTHPAQVLHDCEFLFGN
jgi:peroxiredoxin